MWVGSMTLEHVIICCGVPNKVRTSFAIHVFRLTLEKLSGVILMALSWETFFIPLLFTKYIIHKSTITKNIDQHYSLFVPMLVSSHEVKIMEAHVAC